MSDAVKIRTSRAIAERVRTRALLRMLWMERLWSEGQSSPDQALAISPGEVRRILAPPIQQANHYQSFLQEEVPARLVQQAEDAAKALEADSFWQRVITTFDLGQAERDMLALCVAVELNPKLQRVLAYLADDTRATQPSLAAAAELFGWQHDPPTPMKNVLRWRLLRPAAGEAAWRPATAWSLEEAVAVSIDAELWIEPSFDHRVRLVEQNATRWFPFLYPGILVQMQVERQMQEGIDEATRALCNPETSFSVALIGPDGSGRETLAAQYAASLRRPLVSANVNELLLSDATASKPEFKLDPLMPVMRFARAADAVLYWRDADALTASDWDTIHLLVPDTILGAQTPSSMASRQLTLPALTIAQRLAVWRHYSTATPPSVVEAQRLSPAEIRLVAHAKDSDAVHVALRRSIKTNHDLVKPLACPYTWDDLVVAPNLSKALKAFEAEVTLRWDVYENWGFSRLTQMGQGIAALFAGPSGTGKTMAAQVLARSLDLELYRIDLAGVVNKYIGETEKHLREVFESCERSGALLFFDEADALFGNRTAVKESLDRFSNIEVDYLLQRIEQFSGVAILATNRKSDLDAAFLRRLRFVIDFLPPGKSERRLIWEKSLPALSPRGERITDDLNFTLLADEMELNGAQIKSIALGAAFLARAEGTRIGMQEIEVAAQREFTKQGAMYRDASSKAALR